MPSLSLNFTSIKRTHFSLSSIPKQSGFTPVPNIVLDRLVSLLRDTELRVLLLVCRQTYGRRLPGGGTVRREWISHGWFTKQTGRSSAAISSAIDRLVQLQLIRVTDSNNRLMHTKYERRRLRGKLYFSPSPLLEEKYLNDARWLLGDGQPTSETEDRNVGTIKNTEIKSKNKEGDSRSAGESSRLKLNARRVGDLRGGGWSNAADLALPRREVRQ